LDLIRAIFGLLFLLVSSLRGAKTRRCRVFGRSGPAGSLEIPVITGLDERSPRRKVQEHQEAEGMMWMLTRGMMGFAARGMTGG
jgi:hypothetical protein